MILFGVETSPGSVEERFAFLDFIDHARRRFGFGFAGHVNLLEMPQGSYWALVHLEPLFPPLWRYVAPLLAIVIALFAGMTVHLLWALLPLCLEVVVTNYFHIALFKQGLRQSGYKCKVRALKRNEMLRYLVYHGSD